MLGQECIIRRVIHIIRITHPLFLFLSLILSLYPTFSSGAKRALREQILEDRNAHWQITADKMSYKEEEGLFVAYGNVLITRNGQRLMAKMAKYNERTGIVEVTGSVRLEINGDVLSGERGIFDLNHYLGQITKGRLFLRENHFIINGDAMKKVGPNSYVVTKCKLTTCDGEKPAWSVTASEVKVTVEGYGTVKHATFRIRGIPVFYIPYAIFPAKTKRQTGLLPPRVGYSDRNGLDFELPFYWAISDQTDATFYERYMTDRGLMQGVEFRYVAEEDSKGLFLFDILSDRIKEKNMNDPDEVDLSPLPRTNETRYWLRSRADQQLPWRVRARLDTDFVSDQDYLKEFSGGLYGIDTRPDLAKSFSRPVEDIYSPTRRSALRLSRDSNQYSLQALSAFHQRPENPPLDNTPQPLAALHYSLLPRPVPDVPLFLQFGTDYDYIWRDTGLKGHSFSFTPVLSYPMWVGPYLSFEPTARFTRVMQWVDGDPVDEVRQSKNIYQFDGRLYTVLEKIFPFSGKTVKKLKHKMTPSLTYTYRNHRNEDKIEPWFEPMDAEKDINRLTLTLENLLDTRKENDKGEVTYAQWGTFSLSQPYNIEEARRNEDPFREKRPFEPLVGILTLMPLPGMDFDAEARWDHDLKDIIFTDLSLEFTYDRSGGRKDKYVIDYQYEEGASANLSYYFNLNLVNGFSVGAALKRDLDARHTIGSGYWIDYQSQCWSVRLTAEKLGDVGSVMIQFNLLGLDKLNDNT